MKVANRVRSFFERLLDLVTMSLFVILLFIGLYAFYDARHVVDSGELSDDILAIAPSEENDSFDLAEMQKINNEIIGWIKIDDTHIDYPIMQSTDNSKYLTRNYKGEYATMGSAFADYRNNKLNDDFSIIYAHRMKDGLMFSDVTNYNEQSYFNSHLSGKVYADGKNYDLRVVGFSAVNVIEADFYNIEHYRGDSMGVYLSLSPKFKYQSEESVAEGDKLMMLSTCDTNARYKRDVLLVKLEEVK